MSSRKAGHLQPFTYVDVQLSKGRGASWLVTQVSTIEAYPDILASLDKTVRTSCVLELAELVKALEEKFGVSAAAPVAVAAAGAAPAAAAAEEEQTEFDVILKEAGQGKFAKSPAWA